MAEHPCRCLDALALRSAVRGLTSAQLMPILNFTVAERGGMARLASTLFKDKNRELSQAALQAAMSAAWSRGVL